MKDFKNVFITNKAQKSILKNHPWVYEGEIVKVEDGIINGDIVCVRGDKNKFLGFGFYNNNSKITIRVLSRNANDTFDEAFFRRRVEYALSYRMTVMQNETDCFRVIYGEADFMPGLTVDKFHDILVVQILSLGMDVRKDMILPIIYDVVNKHFPIRGIYIRCDVKLREKEGLEEYVGWYDLNLPILNSTSVQITECGLKYIVDFKEGQKTGFFLDQKFNRVLVRNLSRGKTVLDCCTHTGSFAMNAVLGGAKKVVALDISSKALSDAKANFELNGMNIDTVCADLFDYLQTLASKKKKEFDFIILDPPAFTKSRSTIKSALKGYLEINYLAMKSLPRGGYLATASCSHFAQEDLFLNAIFEASLKAEVTLRQVSVTHASFDHPEIIGVPETKYLKFFIFQVV